MIDDSALSGFLLNSIFFVFYNKSFALFPC